jgi:hypothetical protein
MVPAGTLRVGEYHGMAVNSDGDGWREACDEVTIGDISMAIDFLFITGSETFGPLPDCP